MAEKPHTPVFNGHYIGKGVAVPMQQIKEDVEASLGA